MTEFAPIVIVAAAGLYLESLGFPSPSTGLWQALTPDQQAVWITQAQIFLKERGAFTSANNIAG